MAADNSADPLIGQTIGSRYRIISRLGFGGMGVAYRAWDEQAGVPVVIKMPHKRFLEDPTFAERSIREARVMQGLVHPHVVPVVDVGEHEGLLFLVMRFLPGGSLSNRRLRDEKGKVKPNPPGMLHLWLPAVADALDYIHSQGVVHRDMKPANIFFDAGWGAFVGDFGIAKIIAESEVFEREQTLTATGMGVGTPEYMAPEQFAPKAVVDGRADQYALAVIVYEMLAGVRPFTGESANLILEVLTQPAPRLNEKRSGLPPSLIAAVDRGLSKRPADRFATCHEFAAAALQDVPPIDNEPDVARLLCPKCANLLKLPTSAAGKKGKCPKCQTEMKVADDLGAMWLLDEAKRQEDAASVGGFELDQTAAGSDEQSLESFRSASNTRLIGKTKSRSRPGILSWIDGHGLIIGGVLAIAAVIPWMLLTIGPAPGRARADIQRRETEQKATETRIAELTQQEKLLRKRLEDRQKEVENLQAELARVRSTSPKGPTDTPSPPAVDPQQQITVSIGKDSTGKDVTLTLKLIPAGTFQMGSEGGEPDEKPMHEVRITEPFYLGVTEVTNAQWKAVMGDVPSQWKDDDRPVEQVTWDDVVKFCSELSKRQEKTKPGWVYRLPTEAEWEYACRAGMATPYSFGDDVTLLGEFAWYANNSGTQVLDADRIWNEERKNYDRKLADNQCQTRPVGTRKANPWGLHDMHGNVWEWCSDRLGKYGSGAVRNPQGPSGDWNRVYRGGCWENTAWACRSAERNGNAPTFSKHKLGFRLALSPSDTSTLESGTASKPSEGNREQVTSGTAAPTASPPRKLEDPTAKKPEEILALPPLRNSIGIELKLIPAGTFQMGSNDGEADEKPVHEVQITRPFYLGVTEVTNAQWNAVMGDVPSQWKDGNRPVETVSWDDVVKFCQKVSALPVERAAGREYRLPTEAEWEYACRGGTKTRFSCGDDDANLGNFAWFAKNSGNQTHLVGQKKPNPWGFYDMQGNVSEWCSDWHGPYGADAASDPAGPLQGSIRVERGGSWGFADGFCRSADRDGATPSHCWQCLGFRLALSPSGTSTLESGTASKPSEIGKSQATSGTAAPTMSPPIKLATLATKKPQEILALAPLKNSIGMELKLIPAGTFQMGSNDGDPEEKPVHEVRITRPFYLGVTEVTNAQWKAVMGHVPSMWPEDDRPVEQVSWEDAVRFCEKLSALHAEKMARRIYRLPTEAEWEYACRAGTKTQWSFGDDEAFLGDFAWFAKNAENQTHPVGQKKPNPWGLYDMHGNVWEWCSDWYGLYGAEGVSDPMGPLRGTYRVHRGSCWGDLFRDSRLPNRGMHDSDTRYETLGFRLALSLSGSSPLRARSK